MDSIRESADAEKLAVGLAKLMREEIPDLRPADLGLLIEVFLVLKWGSHEARDALLRHLELLRRMFPGEEGESGAA